MEEKVYLEEISDAEALLLTKLSYVDFNIEKYEEMKLQGKTVTAYDLYNLVTQPSMSYLGVPNSKVEKVVGRPVDTQEEVVRQIRGLLLTNLVVTDIAYDPEINFRAIAFEDSNKSKWISFSGTDFEKIFADKDDNILNHLEESPEQIEAARIFYEHNKQSNGKNYLSGHSLGGNLVSHVYLENYDEIAKAYTINGVPIDKENLDTEEKIEAFSDSDKYLCHAIGGDPATPMKGWQELKPYEDNIRYIENNNKLYKNDSLYTLNIISGDNLIANHLMEGAKYIEGGKFDVTSLEEAYYRYKYKPNNTREKNEPPSNGPSGSDDLFKDIQKKMSAGMDKAKRIGKNIIHKVKDFGSKMFSKGTKLLSDGKEKIENIGMDNTEENIKEDKVLSFRERQQLKNYINEMYTMEDAIEAQEMSDNPRKFMEEKETVDRKINNRVNEGSTKVENEGR